MKVWQSVEGRQAACPQALMTLGGGEAGLCKIGDRRSFVVSIGILANYFDTYDFDVVVELAPGATPAVGYGSVDEDDRGGGIRKTAMAKRWHISLSAPSRNSKQLELICSPTFCTDCACGRGMY
ncbi:hypothetical protein EAH79_11900 [Sphingomonas koreensis]|nr:hypothetical protein EAH79_11900 [Sphingomonas koreensis]